MTAACESLPSGNKHYIIYHASSPDERVHQRLLGRNPLRRVQRHALIEQIDKRRDHLELVVLQFRVSRGHEPRTQVA